MTKNKAFKLGLLGETEIDSLLVSHGWTVSESRKKIRKMSQNKGGEIDRIYAKNKSLLFAEVKTIEAGRVAKLDLRELIFLPEATQKARQVENLFLCASKNSQLKCYVRVFYVVYSEQGQYLNNLLPKLFEHWQPTLKFCSKTEKSLIFSWAPNAVPKHLKAFGWEPTAT